MSLSSRLTLLSAVAMAVVAGPAYAESGAAGASPPARPAESWSAPQPPSQKQDRPAPSGCPYRDGKLELIV
jgi:hypothetical protein